jgi:hypothetical protein
MPNLYDKTSNSMNKILKDKSLTKKEKIRKMFFIFRNSFPDDTQEEVLQACLKYYDYKLGKTNPDKFYFS